MHYPFFTSPSFKCSVFWSPRDITTCYHHTPQTSGFSCLRQWPHSLNWFGWLMKREKYVKGTKQGRHLLENNISKKKRKRKGLYRDVSYTAANATSKETLSWFRRRQQNHTTPTALCFTPASFCLLFLLLLRHLPKTTSTSRWSLFPFLQPAHAAFSPSHLSALNHCCAPSSQRTELPLLWTLKKKKKNLPVSK